ncbi:choice-of-anchor F family protein [Seohaeicola saemankumensis]|uniref:choice-of-anchor F family protein n=1 Tax=Seohaeicola TaxID=481178 RepID=UPI0035D0A6EC
MLRRHIIQPGAQARARLLGTAVTLPLLLAAGLAQAGTLLDAPLAGVSGDGFIFSDPAEGVLEPGLKAVTITPNADWDKVGTSSPSGVLNCLMANNPDILCDAAQGAGKRIKTRLTGPVPLDMRLRVAPSGGVTEYFTYGKTSNLTGARITNFAFVLGTGSGSSFVALSPADSAVLFDDGLIPRFNLPDGLFGGGGQEASGIGFFDTSRSEMAPTNDLFQITTASLDNATHTALFGTGLLDNTMIPNGMFWDASSTVLPDEESVLIAWYHTGDQEWRYGNLGVAVAPSGAPADFATLDERLAALASSLGVDVSALGTTGTDGAAIPAEVLAAMTASGMFEVAPIEDLRNLNLNFMLDVGDIDTGEFTLRIVPVFAPVVQAAGSRAQFVVAGSLDAANVPYLGADAGYLAIIDSVMALAPAERQQALAELGFSAGAGIFGSAYALGTDQFFALPGGEGADAADGSTVSSKGASWSLDGDTRGFVSLGGRVSEADATSNNFGYETESMNAWAGIERNVTPGNWVGVMLGAGEAKTDLALGAGGVDVESMGLGLYARGSMGGNGRYKAMLGWQNLSLDTERNISVLGATATGETDGSVLVAGIEADWLQPRNNWRWGPTASVQFAKVDIDGYAETGAGLGNLTVGDQSTNFLLASAGLRAEADYKVGGGMMHSFAYATITSQTGGDDLISANFAGLPSFSMPVDAMDDTWVDLGVGVSASLAKTATSETTIGAEYKGAFFGDGFESHAVRVSLNVNF